MPISALQLESLRQAVSKVSPDTNTITIETCGIEFDCTAALPSKAALSALLDAVSTTNLSSAISALFAGGVVNLSEQQPALHMALRDPEPSFGLSSTAIQEVLTSRERILELASHLRLGQLPSGELITDIIHIGIGGSDLSPRLLTQALANPQPETPRLHFLSTPASHWSQLATQLRPETTLVIAASKSFGTQEMLYNLNLVDCWLEGAGHRLAITANIDAAKQHGFTNKQILPLWNWVGGRYAFSSAISLIAAINMGASAFQAFLAGAHAMDQHFRQTPLENNLPIRMALVDFWRHIVQQLPGRGVFAFDSRLELLANWLQQLETESNGKQVDQYGAPLSIGSAPLVFGGNGSDAQHALFQMLHQGQHYWPLEFIGVRPQTDDPTSTLLYAQLCGQAQTFLKGDQTAEAHAQMPGGRPVVVTLLTKLDAWHMGALLASYEHKTFCFAHLIGCNPFDQWGVEAGKVATLSALQKLT